MNQLARTLWVEHGSVSPEIWTVKVLCLLADFIIAFFAFAMTVWLANHVGFMINLPAKDVPEVLSPQNVARRLNRAGNYFAVGMKGPWDTDEHR